MALTLPEQVAAAVQRSQHLLITFPKDLRLDALASALALGAVLRQQGKVLDLVADGFAAVPYDFLPKLHITPKVEGLQQFVIKVKLNDAKLEQFSYDLKGKELNIYCTTRGGALKPQDVSAESGGFRYDLIIAVGAPDLASLGKIYTDHREFFERTTIVNIDHQAGNEHYGQINAVDLNAAATAEVVYDLLPALRPAATPEPPLDRAVATALLAGMISATHSFRSSKVTAKTLRIASALVAAGADRDTIIRTLYQSHSVSTLKLWGRTLARLRSDVNGKLVWAPVPESDFLESSASADDLPGVTDALITTLPAAVVVVLLIQEGPDVMVRLSSLRHFHALQLARQFPAHGDQSSATWKMPQRTLPDAEREVIAAIKENLEELEQI
ncbi:MAG: hypothetical protein PHI63_01400 [Patescibacteria group bacterium]|nr:hypothetical protein [Patescibacteria group bacterium]